MKCKLRQLTQHSNAILKQIALVTSSYKCKALTNSGFILPDYFVLNRDECSQYCKIAASHKNPQALGIGK